MRVSRGMGGAPYNAFIEAVLPIRFQDAGGLDGAFTSIGFGLHLGVGF